jgi:hypothetical protein
MENLSLSGLLVIANLIVLVGGVVGGYIVLRSSLASGAAKIQENVRIALKDENEGLQRRLERVEEDNALLKHQLELVVEVLKRQGIILEINGGMVSIKDAKGSTFRSTRQPAPKRAAQKQPPGGNV